MSGTLRKTSASLFCTVVSKRSRPVSLFYQQVSATQVERYNLYLEQAGTRVKHYSTRQQYKAKHLFDHTATTTSTNNYHLYSTEKQAHSFAKYYSTLQQQPPQPQASLSSQQVVSSINNNNNSTKVKEETLDLHPAAAASLQNPADIAKPAVEKKQDEAKAAPKQQPQQETSSDKQQQTANLSAQELLEKLTKQSHTSHLLQPKSFLGMVKDLGGKTVDILKSLPATLLRWSIFLVKGTISLTWQVVKQPSIVITWWNKISEVVKHEAHHYWSGSKLLVADVKYASRLVRKVLGGDSLTRRERLMLEKTVADLFRMVPFIVFVIVPFAELLLPFCIKLFPNMLPSQFADTKKNEEQMKKRIKAQLELAKFLQDTVEVMAIEMKKSTSAETAASAKELESFVHRIRNGEHVHNQDIVRFARFFNDEVTLDSVSRAQLTAMCKYMGLSPYGTESYLRYRLRTKLRKLKADDRFIYWEGVNSLSLEELMLACQERGMKVGLPKNVLRQQLQEWLELSLVENVPASLLILSRAITYTDKVQSEEAIKLALGSLPDAVVQEVSITNDNEYEKKVESYKRQEMLIQQEEEERRKLDVLHTKKQAEAAAVAAAAPTPAALGKTEDEMRKELEREEEDIREIITVMAYASSMTNERAELGDLLDKHNVTMGIANEVKDHSIAQLNERIANMLKKLDYKIEETDLQIGNELNVLDLDKDGVITVEEIEKSISMLKAKPTDDAMKDIIARLDRNGDGRISLQELVLELKEARLKQRHFKEVNASATATTAPPVVPTSVPASEILTPKPEEKL